MNAFAARRPSRKREKASCPPSSPSEGIRNALLRRSWSISSPTTTSDTSSELPKPTKPPRKIITTDDESLSPVTPSSSPKKPPRRYSMSSFDSISSRNEHRGDDATKCYPPQSPAYYTPRRPAQNPPKYLFGAEPAEPDVSRPSTLPRRLMRTPRPLSYGDFEDDPSRFHSMPRKRDPHRRLDVGHFEKGTASKSTSYLSSGPITSTPINSSVPTEASVPAVRREPVAEKMSARIKERHRRSLGEFWEFPDKRAFSEVNSRLDHKENFPQYKKLPKTCHSEKPFHFDGSNKGSGNFLAEEDARRPWRSQPVQSVSHPREEISSPPRWGLKAPLGPNDAKSSCQFGKGFIQSHIDPFEQQNYNQHRKLNRELGTCAQIKPFNYNNQAKTVGEEASTDRHNENKKYSSDFKARNVEERFEWGLDNRRLQESTFVDKSPEFERPFLQMAAPKARLNESERSRSSDTSEGSGFSIGPSELKPRLPRSNTSISSGFRSWSSSMGRMKKKVSSAPVRRSKSFQAGWTRRNAPEVDPYPRRLPPGSHVAKFVLEFEKGIRDTVSNMTSSKGSALTPSTSLRDPHSVYPLVSSRPSRSEPEGHAAAPPDDMQDNSRYKIVFISSGSSSKDSDLSSSGESESPRLIKGSLPKKNNSAPQLVNAQQLTKELLNSDDEHFPRSHVTPPPPPPPPPSEGGGPMFESTNFSELKRNLNSKLFPQEPDNSKKRDDQHSHFTPKMTSLDQGKLEAMLQQTEDVQAEAKALQSALMGAFDKNPATNLFLMKGEVEESPTPKHPSSSSEYENVKVVGKRKEDSRLYENLDFGSNGIIRKVEAGRDASTQTYEEDEDEEDSSDFLSLESSYYEGRSVSSSSSDSCIPDSSPSDRIDKSVETVPFSANRIKYFNYNNNNNHNNNNNNSNNKKNNNNSSKMNNINSHYNNNTETIRLISNEDNDNNNNNKNDDKEYRIKMGMGFRGQEASSSSRPYLADSSPASHTPSPPTVHLRLASDGEQRSVSVSSRCEQVRARELPSSGRFRSYESAVSRRSANQFGVVNNSSVLNESALVTSADGELLSSSSSSIAAAAAAARPGLLRSVNNPVSRPEPPPPPPPLHPSTAHDNSSSTGGGLKLPWRNMNTPENKEEEGDDSTNSVGDVNAFQEVIFSSLECKSGDEAPAAAAAAAAAAAIDGAAEIQSSDTSAGEDTDEDVHVSRSYDVSRLNDEVESDTGASNVDEESATDESGSETDEGRNVTKRYEVTKVSSESDSDVESRDGDAIMSEVDIQRDSNEIKNLSDMCSALLGGRMEEDIPEGEGPLKCEGEVIGEEVSISDTEEELPECDQVLEEEEGAGIVRDSGDEVGPPPEEGREEEDVDAQSVCHEDEEEEKEDEDDDLAVENKSETESIIGLEVDSLEDGNKGELLEDGGPLNSEEVKEGSENHQVQESDPGEKRSEEDEGKTKSDGESPRGDDEVLGEQDCHEHESLTREHLNDAGSSCHANLETITCHPESSLEATNESTTAPSGALTNDAFDIIKSSNCSECQSPEISGSQELEQENGSRFQEESEAVLNRSLVGSHESAGVGDVSVPIISDNISNISANDVNSYISNRSDALISQSDKTVLNSSSSSESGHSSGGESDDVDDNKEPDNVLKINVAEKRSSEVSEKRGSRKDVRLTHTEGKVGKRGSSIQCLNSSKFSSKGSTPPVPLRKARLSSSSDGLSSSSDVDRSDADASDSADTVIEGTKLHSKRVNSSARSDANRDSDGPSSADSVLQGVDSESQCSDGSEEGNLITIVAVGEETILKPSSSQGKIYIRSDSTDSDVQIKPTCIVVTGSSGDDSSEDSENDDQNKTNSNTENEVTILEVTSDHRKDHVMSVRVTSPESSRSASPSRKSTVSELQSMILTTREKQQQFRRPTVEVKESSGLTNYFTVTLGTDSPATPRRLNKTPEVRRRKVPEKDEKDSTGTNLAVRSPTLTPSPSHTPSPTLTPTPDHSEGDLLALEEHHEDSQTDPENSRDNLTEEGNEIFEYEGNFDQYDYHDLHQEEEMEGPFDSIEDTDSLCDSNNSETSSEEGFEREEELRGYCKRGYDFTLHTIIEESCEESDYDKKVHEEENVKRDTSELEQYFYFGLGNGPAEPKKFANEESEYSDTFSETSSSIYSEGMESLDCEEEVDPAELASSRLEKYFSGFSGFERQPSIRSVGEESEMHTDESGSVGSDSEGSPSPEQPRKRLFRSRGVRSVSSNRSSHGYSSDKGDGVISDGSHHSGEGEEDKTLVSGEDEGSTESEETAFDKGDGQFDTIKRRKKKKLVSESSDKKLEDRLDPKTFLIESRDDNFNSSVKADFGHTIFNEIETSSKNIDNDDPKALKNQSKEIVGTDLVGRKYQSRDSGFIGSSDDLLKDKPDDMIIKGGENDEIIPLMANLKEYNSKKLNEKNSKVQGDKENGFKDIPLENEPGNSKSENEERSSNEGKVSRSSTGSSVDLPPYSQSKGCPNLNRKDSFNNWSSDEETNIMMNKMRIFFKNMFSNVGKEAPKGQRIKSPQLVMFEAKLTNLMRSVPGINDEQVKEIMEYLSSEETWSDSYDSSDYTSSDLEGTYPRLDQADPELKSELQEQISASCQQIIKNFDQSREPSDTDSSQSLFGGRANSESSEASSKDTAFVYQKLMSSISHMKPESERGSIGSGSQSTSPSLLMKVMPYIRDRLVALMHEVSAGSENGDDVDSFNGGNPVTSSPRQKLFLPKKHSISDNLSLDSSVDKSSLTSTSFESEDSPTDTEQSPESDTGTPKIFRRQKLSIISEKSSAEDFTSLESQRTVFSSHDSPRYYFRHDMGKTTPAAAPSQRSLEERSGPLSSPFGRNKEEEKFFSKEYGGLLKGSRNGRRAEARKAKSHMSLEKIHQEEVKTTGERSESLGDLLDRVRSSSEFSSSYEQLDSDSTLKASDSLDRHIGSSNVRLNASSRGSLTTSSRGSLATSSRGSLNASSRGSLQGSSGPEEEEDRKGKKLLPFFRYARRSSVPDASKDGAPSPEVRSTTLPRSTPAQILTTGTLPRSQSSHPSRSSSGALTLPSPSLTTNERPSLYHSSGGPRSARYHPPGYRPPPAGLPPKRTYSTPTLRKDKRFPSSEESGAVCGGGVSAAEEESTGAAGMTITAPVPPPPSRFSVLGGGGGGSLGRGSLASFERSAAADDDDDDDDDDEGESFKRRGSDGGGGGGTRSPLISLGPKSRSESLASVCSYGEEGRYNKVPVQGEMRVALQYNYKEGQLECHIIQCRDLAPVDAKRIRSDPYVKAYLLPDKSKSGKRKTKVKRHTLNPTFEELFKFATSLSELESRVLWISVWHSDMFGRNVFLGEVHIPLSDAIFEDSSPKWFPLLEREPSMETLNYGSVLIVALKFVPPDVLVMSGGSGGSTRRSSKRSRGALHVRVKEASGLTLGKNCPTPPDPICKGVLMPERKGKSSKQKTNVLRKTSNPKWNHTMTFDDVTLQELSERSLELSIWNHDRFGSPTFLGGCRLNLGKGHHNNKIVDWLDASGLEQKLWEQMLDRPNLWVESSILLRPNIDRPIYSSAFTD